NNGTETLFNGEWNTITFGASSTGNVMDHVDVRRGGANSTGTMMVSSMPQTLTNLTLTNSVIRNSASAGVRIAGSNPTLTSNTFQNNAGAAISMDLASDPTITGIVTSNNAVNGVNVEIGRASCRERVWNAGADDGVRTNGETC